MKTKTLVFLFAISLTMTGIGCGGGDADGGGADNGQVETPTATMPEGSASVTGTVNFEGTPPERPPLDLNRECMELHEEPPLAKNVVVNDNGTLRWVFVYVKEGIDETYPTPTDAVTLDQQGCEYTPHVLGMQAGQTIRILNSDPFLHNIHALPEENRPFNFGMPIQGGERERTFREPEVMVRIKCDVHGWMEAWVGVLNHPFHSTTDEQGAFSLANLPAGDYVIEAWHEDYGTQTQNVTVGEGETATVDFTFGSETTAQRDDAGASDSWRYVTWNVGG